MAPTDGVTISTTPRTLERPGYHKMETGWTRMENGTTVISVLAHMAGATADMWDWWMSWHLVETARYKLWYPDAHQFAALADDRSADRSLTYRQRYRENVSFVDEYIGGTLSRLAIRFVDPARLGFTEKPGYTVIAGLGTSALAPVSTGWVVHQVCPTNHGSEMRSRFWIGPGEPLDLPASSMADRPGAPADQQGSSPAREAAAAPGRPTAPARQLRLRSAVPLRQRDEPPRLLPAGPLRRVQGHSVIRRLGSTMRSS